MSSIIVVLIIGKKKNVCKIKFLFVFKFDRFIAFAAFTWNKFRNNDSGISQKNLSFTPHPKYTLINILKPEYLTHKLFESLLFDFGYAPQSFNRINFTLAVEWSI